jgi:two-component system nitrogen regulation sensor histidine kinase GlnL
VRDWLVDPAPLVDALRLVSANEVACGRFDALLERQPVGTTELPVHVIVSQLDGGDEVLVEMIEIEQQTRSGPRGAPHRPGAGQQGADPQPGARDQEPAGRHPRRGAVAGDGDRLARADRVHPGHHPRGRPPAGAGRPPAGAAPPAARGGDVNIHEVCERVRSLILAEFPRGLKVQRDYDTSIPSSAATASS